MGLAEAAEAGVATEVPAACLGEMAVEVAAPVVVLVTMAVVELETFFAELELTFKKEEGEIDVREMKAEEFHTCLVCHGVDDKEGLALSMDRDNISHLRYHYAGCFYQKGVYYSLYSPETENMLEDGSPRDHLGKEVKYDCREKGCNFTKKRNIGYKEFVRIG